MIFWRGEGSRRAGAGLRFAEEWAAEEILDQVGSRLAAGRSHRRVTACTPARRGPTFVCAKVGKTHLGHSPKRILVPFVRTKGTPPRRAVLTMPLQKAPRRRQATANYPPPCRRTGYAFAKGPAPPLGDRQLGLKFLLLLFMGEKQALPAGGFYSAGKAARRQVRETSER